MYGLLEEQINEIKKIGEKYNIIIHIFGSRARGNYKYNSDIDLAVMTEVSEDIKYKIMDEFDRINIQYKIDLIFIQNINNENFLNSIKTEGVKI